MLNITERLVLICAALAQFKVRYLSVGGTAVNFFGYYRLSIQSDGTVANKPDFDFWFQPTYLNYMRLLDALEAIGLDVKEYKEEKFPFPKASFFRFRLKEYTLDFLPRIAGGLTFGECYGRRVLSQINDTEISIISLADLIITKKAAGRKKDLDDVAELQKRSKHE